LIIAERIRNERKNANTPSRRYRSSPLAPAIHMLIKRGCSLSVDEEENVEKKYALGNH